MLLRISAVLALVGAVGLYLPARNRSTMGLVLIVLNLALALLCFFG
ncbi:MAG TPA: hypothetical protein VKC57_05120 [Ktedonobacterales bacterium]|nr:hypothetical protein [Ktedonobacterales bacterium]